MSEPRKLKELLKLQERGEMNDLTNEEVEELIAYARLTEQVAHATSAQAQIEALKMETEKRLLEIKNEFSSRIFEMQQEDILHTLKTELEALESGENSAE